MIKVTQSFSYKQKFSALYQKAFKRAIFSIQSLNAEVIISDIENFNGILRCGKRV